MRTLRMKDTSEPIQKLIDDVVAKMRTTDIESKEYAALMENLIKLYALKTRERRDGVKMDTLAIIAGNLAGLLIVVAYEQRGHFWSQNALRQTLRPKAPSIQL